MRNCFPRWELHQQVCEPWLGGLSSRIVLKFGTNWIIGAPDAIGDDRDRHPRCGSPNLTAEFGPVIPVKSCDNPGERILADLYHGHWDGGQWCHSTATKFIQSISTLRSILIACCANSNVATNPQQDGQDPH